MPQVSRDLLHHVLGHVHVTTLYGSRQRHEQGYRMELRTIRDWNFIYSIRGLPVWIVAGVAHPLPPQTLILVPPGVPHHAECRTPEVTLGSLHVLATLPGGQDAFRLLGPPLMRTVAPGTRLDRYLRAYTDEFDRPDQERLAMMPGWAHLITRELFLHDAAAGLLTPRTADPLVDDLLTVLGNHLDRPLALGELARRAGYTPQHLNRVFQRVLGTTPLKYLAASRLDHAAVLLRQGHLTVAEIARRVGYPDPAYFCRQFSRRFAMTPSEYRSQSGSESPAPGSAAPG